MTVDVCLDTLTYFEKDGSKRDGEKNDCVNPSCT